MLKKIFKSLLVSICMIMTVMPVFAEMQIREPVQQESLTPEQESEGWVMIDGYAYSPEYIEAAGNSLGQTGDQMYDIKTAAANGVKTNLVTITADVPAGMTDPVYMEIMDGTTYQTYYIELYAATGYSDNFKLPNGYYYFMAGGPTNDTMSVFHVADPEYFMVQDEAVSVTAYIRPRGTILQQPAEEEEIEAVSVETKTEETPATQDTQPRKRLYLITSIIMFAIGIGLTILWVIYSKKSE